MNKDIILVDDDNLFIRKIQRSLKREQLDLTLIPFTIPSEALEHIIQRSEAPLGYFVDMKPYSQSEIDKLGLSNLPELPIPERIFEYVKSRSWTTHFYFTSAHRSPHDDDVLKRTGAQFLSKYDKENSIYQKLEMIANEINH